MTNLFADSEVIVSDVRLVVQDTARAGRGRWFESNTSYNWARS